MRITVGIIHGIRKIDLFQNSKQLQEEEDGMHTPTKSDKIKEEEDTSQNKLSKNCHREKTTIQDV